MQKFAVIFKSYYYNDKIDLYNRWPWLPTLETPEMANLYSSMLPNLEIQKLANDLNLVAKV